jgi:hypothetical protein
MSPRRFKIGGCPFPNLGCIQKPFTTSVVNLTAVGIEPSDAGTHPPLGSRPIGWQGLKRELSGTLAKGKPTQQHLGRKTGPREPDPDPAG